MVETAIFGQWFYNNIDLHYARWNDGEVGIVNITSNWRVEIKWSDLVINDARKLKGLVKYIKSNKIENSAVTTKTISKERIIDSTLIEFIPGALYAYMLGKNYFGKYAN